MFDFEREYPSFLQALYCFVFYIIFFALCYKDYYTCKWIKTNHTPKLSTPIAILFFLFTLTYFVDSDYFHYYSYIKQIANGFNIATTEPVYKSIAWVSQYNYIIFRAIIWGSGLYIVSFIAKKAGIKPDFVLYLLFILYFGLFAYARASLAMAIAYCGFYYWSIEPHKYHDRMLGMIIMIIALAFHTSMIITILCCLVAPLLHWSKRRAFIYIFAIPLISTVIKFCLSIVINSGTTEAMIVHKLIYYSGSENVSGRTLLGKIQNTLEILTFVYPLILISYRVFFTPRLKDLVAVKFEIKLYKIAFLLVAISIAFLNIGLSTEVFSYRIRYMSMIPIVLSLTGLLQKNVILKKDIQICLLIGFIGTTMGLLSAVNHS